MMKKKSFTPGLILFCSFLTMSLSAQPTSSLTPETLTFSDASNSMIGVNLNLNGLHIENGFNFTTLTENSVSAGSDLLRTVIGDNGFTFSDFALLPSSKSNLDRKRMTFVTEGIGPMNGVDRETWSLGISDVGDFDNSDIVKSGFYLDYMRQTDNNFTIWPILFVNPENGGVGIGTYSLDFSAQLYVDEWGQDQVGVWSNHDGSSNSARWGIFGTAAGEGLGNRYGVHGAAHTSNGTKYGIYGQTSGGGTEYAVFANGNLAYTGAFSSVSDRKFKKNIKDFTALDRVMDLKPKSYDMKQEEFKRMNLATGTQFGFIAQELQEVFPELVHENINAIPYQESQDTLLTEEIKYLGVDYVGMVPILTKAMQEQQKMIEDKEDRIARLERENRNLKQKNEDLEHRLDQLEILVQQLVQNKTGHGNALSVSDAQLMQNQPNPFSNSTNIPHFIPVTVKKAELLIADAAGRVLKSIVVESRGAGQTILDTHQLGGGIYFYTLILDGKNLDTKKMVLMGRN